MPNCDYASSANCPNNSNNQQSKKSSTIGGYKEVVIIGNGPSGLCLSYFLSGHWPYWNKNRVSDEYLQMRLEYADNGLSLVEQDLEYLADGLEGRSANPVALLYDKLKHPDGDLGLDLPTCLSWRYDPLKEVDHICIGKAPGPGGAWNDIDGSQLTISPSRWMELPDMSYADWKRQSRTLANMNAGLVFSAKTPNFSEDNSLLNGNLMHLKNHHHNFSSSSTAALNAIAAASMRRSLSQAHLLTPEESRVSMHDVKNYYQDYARQKNLDKYLLNNATVTAVRRVYCCSKLVNNHNNNNSNSNNTSSSSSASSVDLKSDSSGETMEQHQQHQVLCWEVSGLIDNRPDRKKASSLTHKGDLMEFRFWCRHLVLANGASDLHNELNVKGERSRFILRSIRELEEKIKEDLPRLLKDPLLIVGSGLSAADAILLAQKYHIRIIHVIRKSVHDPNLIFNKLPKKLYPEYHRVYDQMVRNRYTNCPAPATTSTTAATAASSADLINVAASEININNNNTSGVVESDDDRTLYVLYDEHQVQQFTSKRTCVLRNTSVPTVSTMPRSNRSSSGLLLGTTPPNSHMRHFHLQKSHHHHHHHHHHLGHHHHHGKRHLGDCDEEDATCDQLSRSDSTCSINGSARKNDASVELKISYACILIGYSPDLQFLPPGVVNDLGIDAGKPLDTKDNPIWIDRFTHETVKCKSLYAMGPLIGDNFVRFGTGGALAIANTIWKSSGRRIQQKQQQQLLYERRNLRPFSPLDDNNNTNNTNNNGSNTNTNANSNNSSSQTFEQTSQPVFTC